MEILLHSLCGICINDICVYMGEETTACNAFPKFFLNRYINQSKAQLLNFANIYSSILCIKILRKFRTLSNTRVNAEIQNKDSHPGRINIKSHIFNY